MKKRLSDFVSEAVAFMTGGVYDIFGRQNWGKGEALFVQTNTDGSREVTSDALVTAMPIVTKSSDLSAQKNKTFQDVFNKWQRIAYVARNPSANPEELNTWNYDATNDQVVCTVNSVSTVGFISPQAYDNYTFEVTVSSTDGDDDAIGLCVAYLDNGDGTADGLFLYRLAGSNVNPVNTDGVWALQLNLNTSVALAGVSAGLHFPDGTAVPEKITTNGANGSWSTLGPITLKVVRNGSVITCSTTDKGGSAYVASFSFDLNSRADTKKFIAPCRIGYIAYSQPNATFKVIQQPGSRDPIVDITDGSVWKWENNQWVQYPESSPALKALIKQGRFFSSTVDGGLYFAFSDGTLTLVAQTNPTSA